MTYSKDQFSIDVDGDKITVSKRHSFLWVFSIWIELCSLDVENGDERVVTFDSIEDAEKFLNDFTR